MGKLSEKVSSIRKKYEIPRDFGLTNCFGLCIWCRDSQTYTTVSCASTSGAFKGSKTLATKRSLFKASELKDILLGEKQKKDMPMPYPPDMAVAPRVRDLQDISIHRSPSSFTPKVVYFTLLSKNLADQYVFCTISGIVGL
jgi:hypothetical protein